MQFLVDVFGSYRLALIQNYFARWRIRMPWHLLWSGDRYFPNLQELVKKRLDISLLAPTLTNAKEIGINVTTSFITGFPDETLSDLKATWIVWIVVTEFPQRRRACNYICSRRSQGPRFMTKTKVGSCTTGTLVISISQSSPRMSPRCSVATLIYL